MLNPAARRLIAVVLALAGASLACERAEILIVPAQPAISTPRNVVLAPTQAQIQATATSGNAATPIAQASPTTEAGPIASETPAAPAETPTSVVALPTDTPLPPTPTPQATDTPPPTDTPQQTATVTSAPLNPPTPTQAQPQPTAPSGGGPQPIPPNATFTQQFTVSNEGGSVVGRPVDMTDGRTDTWASLRGGNAAWIFDLGSQQRVAGLRVWAQPDGGDPTTLLSIQVSNDRTNWTTVYTGSGDCGVPNCDTLAQKEFVDLGFNPTTAQYVRMNGGPTRFAFAEAQIAVAP
ncbi:MAG TPA: discoidin domain-containing protein [Anaerolineales bacterium]|nr:discoidin domain-containing protein [Anaerolineales bacterium]